MICNALFPRTEMTSGLSKTYRSRRSTSPTTSQLQRLMLFLPPNPESIGSYILYQ